MTDSELIEHLQEDFKVFRMEHDKRIEQKYVAKVPGKDLSEENFTPAEKNKLASLTGGSSVDFSQFATKLELNEAISAISGGGSGIDTSIFATKTELNDFIGGTSIFATKAELNNVIGGTSIFVTKTELNNVIGGLSNDVDDLFGALEEIRVTEMPVASASSAGCVVIDGNGLIMDGDTLKVNYPDATTITSGLMSASDKIKLNHVDTSQYVQREDGKGLSTNDYTDEDKNKLASISVSGGNVVIDTSNFVLKEAGKQLSTEDYTAYDKTKLSNLASITSVGENIFLDDGTIRAIDTRYSAGDNIFIKDGVISAINTTYTPGDNIEIDHGRISATYTAGANISLAGGRINAIYEAGKNIAINANTISSTYKYELPVASESVLGGVQIGQGLYVRESSGTLHVNIGDNLSLTSDNKICGAYGVASKNKDGLMGKEDKADLAYCLEKLATLNGASGIATSLPTASATQKGGVIVTGNDGLTMDGDTLKATGAAQLIDLERTAGCIYYDGLAITQGNNTIIAEGYDFHDGRDYFANFYFTNGIRSRNITNVPPTASATVKGAVKIGAGLVMQGETLNAMPTEIPTASEDVKGGIKIGEEFYMDGDTLHAIPQGVFTGEGLESECDGTVIMLKTASAGEIGGVKVTGNDGLYMDGDTLKVDYTDFYSEFKENFRLGEGLRYGDSNEGELLLETASSDCLGGVIVTGDDGLYMDGDTLKVDSSGFGGGKYVYVFQEGFETQWESADGGQVANVGLKAATAGELGGVKVTGNDGLEINNNGVLKSNYTFPNKVTLQSGFTVADSIASNFGKYTYIDIDNYSRVRVQDNSTVEANSSCLKLDHSEINLTASNLKLSTSDLICSGFTNINGNPVFNNNPTFKGTPRFEGGIYFDATAGTAIESIRITDGKLKIICGGVSYFFTPDSN